MESLSEANFVNNQPYQMHGVYAAELGPYERAYTFRVRAFAYHDKGGDGSSARLTLYYDGAEVGESVDDNGGFNETTVHVEYEFYLAAGGTAQLRFTTENHKATLETFGFDFWWS